MNKDESIKKLKLLRSEIPRLKQLQSGNAEFKKWHRDVLVAVEHIFKKSQKHLDEFNSISYSVEICTSDTPDYIFHEAYKSGLDEADSILMSFIDEINEYWNSNNTIESSRHEWTNLLDNFHKIATKIRNRHDNRPTIEVEDEYDVQDLLYSLLHIFFNDIRKEEWTPSYAGSCSRVDFLLNEIKTVVEIKKTRKGIKDKEIGEQLLIDIARYKAHPGCKGLVCFIYDPEGRISNPKGLVDDLCCNNDFQVKVIIRPIGI